MRFFTVFCLMFLFFCSCSAAMDNTLIYRDYKITGGEVVNDPDEWPWMAALFYSHDSILNRMEFFCGAALVAPDWVLTAAHCVYDINDTEMIKVFVGGISIMDIQPENVFEVREIYVHPYWGDFRLVTPDSDIALVHLSGQADIPFVRVYRGDDDLAGENAVALGWGSTCGYGVEECSNRPASLSVAEMPVVSTEICNEAAAGFGMLPVDRSSICAGDGSGTDTCAGDSGGPLLVEMDGEWVEVGITSYGMVEPCGTPGSYGVYSSISALSDFVDYYLSCVPVGDSLDIHIPCVEYGEEKYDVMLEWLPGRGVWKLTGVTANDDDIACTEMDSSLSMNVCVDYRNRLYRFDMIPAGMEDGAPAWMIDADTVRKDPPFRP